MSTRISCPGCGRSLRLPIDCTAEMLSCPRCLARIPNPQAPASSAAIQAETPAALTPAAPAEGITERSPYWTRAADVDVRRDSRRTSGCLIALAVLGGIGVSWTLLSGIAAASDGSLSGLTVLFSILSCFLVLAVISSIWVFVRHPGESPGTIIGRTVLGVLTISGVLVLLLAAALIFLFVVCLVSA